MTNYRKNEKATLLIPCAGKSTRYPGTRPKWMLTTPEGKLVVHKALESAPTDRYDRVVIAIRSDHDNHYQAQRALRIALGDDIDIVVIDHDTRGPAETVQIMIDEAEIKGPIMIKDADCFFSASIPTSTSFVSVCDLRSNLDISRIGAKSFVKLNEQNLVTQIVEKSVCSNYISVGFYGLSSTELFADSYARIRSSIPLGEEIFVSHVLSESISSGEIVEPHIVDGFIDLGVLLDWQAYCHQRVALFVDIDGVVVKNQSKYFEPYWDQDPVPIDENVNCLRAMQNDGAQLIFATARPEEYREKTLEMLKNINLVPHALVMNCLHGRRFLINDYARSNPYPAAVGINIERNKGVLSDMLL